MLAWLLKHLDFEVQLLRTSVLSDHVELVLKTSLVSNCFVAIILFLYLITTLYSIGYLTFERDKHKVRFHSFIALSSLMAIGLAYSANLFTAFIFYDLLSVCTYMLVKHHGDENSEKHALTYAYYLLLPSMILLLPAIILIYNFAGHTNFIVGGVLGGIPISQLMINILFFMCIYGISKTAIYPLHKWLIHAMVAPSPVSALLHAVLVVKGGLFLMYKVINETFGLEFLRQNIYSFNGVYWPELLAGASIILAAVSAIASDNIKQRLAYSTISQIGYVSLCMFCFTDEAMAAAKMQFVAHSFAKINLFFYAGYLMARYHATTVSELKFTRNRLPVVLSIMWLVPAISLMSMPITLGFLSKHSMVHGLITGLNFASLANLFVLVAGMFLCIAYLYPLIFHMLSFTTSQNRKRTGQFWSTFLVYLSVFIVSVCTVGLGVVLN